VTDDGKTKLVKFRFRSLQGTAALVWEEAQAASKNPDYHRGDLFESIEQGIYPEWEFEAQIMDEEDQLRFGFDLLDPTKWVSPELVPFTPLGKLTLNRNPRNYFAETEQVMFQPGHIVRGIDFTNDPLLQGRLFSYLDTQLNRHGGPNFEQIPINQPRVSWHNNNRDGAAQMYVPLNTAAYSPNTLNDGYPKQANETEGRGFYTAPNRQASGGLIRAVSSTFADVWSHPRLFFNSLHPVEQQFVINGMRFETSQLKSDIVKNNVLIQLNRVSHDVAERVAKALGMKAPEADPTYYHDNKTSGVSIAGQPLLKIDGLKVGYLTSNKAKDTHVEQLKKALARDNVAVKVVAETLTDGVDQTYSATDASQFDAVVVGADTDELFTTPGQGTFYPPGRPLRILQDGYRWGKPVGSVKKGSEAFEQAGIAEGAGVYTAVKAKDIADGLKTFKFLDRFPVDQE
jgi:catalase